jgi:uncharacterized protein involved in exopolysaccharide biosynthesis
LLAAYPRAHRKEYGGPMAQLFRDQCRDAWKRRRFWGLVWLWLRVLPDLVKTAVWERLTTRRERKYMFRKFFGGLRSRPALLGVFMAVSFAVFLLCLISSTIITFILPEVFSSRARIRMELEGIAMAGAPDRSAAGGVYDPYLVQTEFEVIQSEKILDRVIDALDLNTAWAAKFGSPTKLKNNESRALLKAMIEVHPARSTSLLDIVVYSDDKAEAAKIANCIAEVYQTYHRNQRDALIASQRDSYKTLKDELKHQLADKTNDAAAVDAQITATIQRAGETYQSLNPGISIMSVEIIEHAEPGFRPVRPNKPLNIFLGGAIGAILGILIGGITIAIIAGAAPNRTAVTA